MNDNKGIVIKSIGGLYNVETPLGIYECAARGIFRKMNISPYVGDSVLLEEITDSKAVISEICERKNSLIRPPLANLDQLIFVISTCEPAPNFTLLDKFIAISVYKGIDNIIAVTKTDIEKNPELMNIYKKINMDIIEIDYTNPQSYMKLYDKLENKISAFTGNTGVGKSTLLNHINTNLGIRTNEISKKLGRGKHTTRHVELYKLDNGGYIADTPGFSTFETNKYDIIFKENLASCFVEFAEYEDKCRFKDCSHTKEKGCAVIEAVQTGLISSSRHNSYVTMYNDAMQIKEWEVKDKTK